MIEVCVVGEINLDLILYGLPENPLPDHEHLASNMAFTVGGSSGIFAHNLRVLGTELGFICKIGNDPLGKMAADRLSTAGVDISRVKQGTASTSTGLTVVLPHAQHRFMFNYPGTTFELQYSDIDLDYLLSARHFHLSSFYLHRALRPQIVNLFRQAKHAGLTTSLDTNEDPENQWAPDLLEVLQYVDIFLPNDREGKKIAGTDDSSQALNFLAQHAKIVVIKRGSAAAICRTGNEQWSATPPSVQMVDDIGAGDSFDAGFIHAYLLGAKLDDCLAFANLAAAYSLTKPGGTDAFCDRNALSSFIHEQWKLTGRGPLPMKNS